MAEYENYMFLCTLTPSELQLPPKCTPLYTTAALSHSQALLHAGVWMFVSREFTLDSKLFPFKNDIIYTV